MWRGTSFSLLIAWMVALQIKEIRSNDESCPLSHPYVFNGGLHCCSVKSDASGQVLLYDSISCGDSTRECEGGNCSAECPAKYPFPFRNGVSCCSINTDTSGLLLEYGSFDCDGGVKPCESSKCDRYREAAITLSCTNELGDHCIALANSGYCTHNQVGSAVRGRCPAACGECVEDCLHIKVTGATYASCEGYYTRTAVHTNWDVLHPTYVHESRERIMYWSVSLGWQIGVTFAGYFYALGGAEWTEGSELYPYVNGGNHTAQNGHVITVQCASRPVCEDDWQTCWRHIEHCQYQWIRDGCKQTCGVCQ